MPRQFGETMMFTGGAESTPKVTVGFFEQSGSLNAGNKSLTIEQNGSQIQLSPATMRAILDWYGK